MVRVVLKASQQPESAVQQTALTGHHPKVLRVPRGIAKQIQHSFDVQVGWAEVMTVEVWKILYDVAGNLPRIHFQWLTWRQNTVNREILPLYLNTSRSEVVRYWNDLLGGLLEKGLESLVPFSLKPHALASYYL